jgi:hypothetical protein
MSMGLMSPVCGSRRESLCTINQRLKRWSSNFNSDEGHTGYLTYCGVQGDKMVYGTVKNRKRDYDGELISTSNKNPLLEVYEVEFHSGEVEAYYANIITESIYSTLDDDGYTRYMLREIVDHCTTDVALKLDDVYYTNKRSGKKKLKQTNQGLRVMCQVEQ